MPEVEPTEDWRVIKEPFKGIRIYHGGFVDWPMVTRDGVVKLVKYQFDGDKSSGTEWIELPGAVREKVMRFFNRY